MDDDHDNGNNCGEVADGDVANDSRPQTKYGAYDDDGDVPRPRANFSGVTTGGSAVAKLSATSAATATAAAAKPGEIRKLVIKNFKSM